MTDAIRRRLPGVADTVTQGELARDASDKFAQLVPLQLVEAPGMVMQDNFLISMKRAPKMVLVYCKFVGAPDVTQPVWNPAPPFVWEGRGGVRIKTIDGLTAGTKYDFVFLGVG
jgi:hypothetical protein